MTPIERRFRTITQRRTLAPIEIIPLTTAELAKRWQMCAGTLNNWRVQGHGPKFMKIGAQVRYSLAEVEAWEKLQERRSTVG